MALLRQVLRGLFRLLTLMPVSCPGAVAGMVHRTLGGVFSVDLTTPELSFGLIFDMLVFYCMARRTLRIMSHGAAFIAC